MKEKHFDFNKLIELRNTANPFTAHLGIRTTHIHEGHARAEVELKPWFFNINGSLHGGLLFTLADTTGGAAAQSYGCRSTTVSSSVSYLKTARQGCQRLVATADCHKKGRHLIYLDVSICDDQDNELVRASFVYYVLNQELDLDKELEKVRAQDQTSDPQQVGG